MNVGQFLRADGSKRTINVVHNIYRSLLYKGTSIIATLLLVPLSLHYLNKEQYGLWLTLTSLTGWLTFFDIGIGNGLRNRLAESLTRNQLTDARQLVSTAYAFVGIVMLVLWLIFLMVSPFIDWTGLFGVSDGWERDLGWAGAAAVSLFFAQTLLLLINPVLNAYQQNSKTGLIILVTNVGSLIAVFTLTMVTHGSFLLFCIVQMLVTFGSYLSFNLYYFYYNFPEVAPSISHIDPSKLKSMMSLGIQFFIMQIAAVVLYQTNNILIARWFGPGEVTDYNISYRYFNVVSMGFSILTAPLWSSFTDAYTQLDYAWIRMTMKRLVQFWIAMQLGIVVMLLNADWVYRTWTGDVTDIPFGLSLANAVYVSLYAWNSIFIMFLNGTGHIRLQFMLTLLILVAFFPLAYGMAVVAGAGVVGIVWANCLCLAVFSIQAPLQYLGLIRARVAGCETRQQHS